MNDSDGHNVQILTLEAREPQATITANPSATPFIPDPSTLQPVPPSNSNSKAGPTKASMPHVPPMTMTPDAFFSGKSVVEFLLLGVATLIVASIIIRR